MQHGQSQQQQQSKRVKIPINNTEMGGEDETQKSAAKKLSKEAERVLDEYRHQMILAGFAVEMSNEQKSESKKLSELAQSVLDEYRPQILCTGLFAPEEDEMGDEIQRSKKLSKLAQGVLDEYRPQMSSHVVVSAEIGGNTSQKGKELSKEDEAVQSLLLLDNEQNQQHVSHSSTTAGSSTVQVETDNEQEIVQKSKSLSKEAQSVLDEYRAQMLREGF